jgi:hypothetical protein
MAIAEEIPKVLSALPSTRMRGPVDVQPHRPVAVGAPHHRHGCAQGGERAGRGMAVRVAPDYGALRSTRELM